MSDAIHEISKEVSHAVNVARDNDKDLRRTSMALSNDTTLNLFDVEPTKKVSIVSGLVSLLVGTVFVFQGTILLFGALFPSGILMIVCSLVFFVLGSMEMQRAAKLKH